MSILDRLPGMGGSSHTLTGGRAHIATPESESKRWDAAQRMAALIERREELQADADDAEVMSELVGIEAEMAEAEKTIRSSTEGATSAPPSR